jgi:hypothetical protein
MMYLPDTCSGQRLNNTVHRGIKIAHISTNANGKQALCEWTDGEKSEISAAWLEQHTGIFNQTHRAKRNLTIKETDYSTLLHNSKGVFEVLDNIVQDGVTVVKNVDRKNREVER